MRYAVTHNLTVQEQEARNDNLRQAHTDAIAALLPTLGASSSIRNSYGRSINPETNTYGTTSNLSNSYTLSSDLTLFSGLANIYALRASEVRRQGGEHTLQQLKDQQALEVMRLYYDVLYFEQSIELMAEQLEASKRVLLLTRKQLELGLKSEADVALAAAQVANYDLLHTRQQGQYKEGLLNLKEAMNFPFSEELRLVAHYQVTPQVAPTSYDIALNPLVAAAASQLSEQELNLRIAKGRYYPTLSLQGGLSTNFFRQYDVESLSSPFFNQIQNNYGYYIGAALSIPIFNRLSRRSSVVQSRNNLRIASLQHQATELAITKQVEGAILSQSNFYKEYVGAQHKIEANELAYSAVEERYKQGMVSIIELQRSANDLLLAKSEELRAGLSYLIQCKLVDYYSGISLIK